MHNYDAELSVPGTPCAQLWRRVVRPRYALCTIMTQSCASQVRPMRLWRNLCAIPLVTSLFNLELTKYFCLTRYLRGKIAPATKTTVLDKNQPTGAETEKLVKKTLVIKHFWSFWSPWIRIRNTGHMHQINAPLVLPDLLSFAFWVFVVFVLPRLFFVGSGLWLRLRVLSAAHWSKTWINIIL